jgi:hypothetical protein
VRGEQDRLLRVGAEAARHAQEETGLLARRRCHAVESERDVGPHRLALPIGE